MKLLVISTWFPWPPDNGSKSRAYHLLRELAKRHRITLLSFCGDGEPAPERLAPLSEFCESVQAVARGPFHQGALTMRGMLSGVPRAYVQGFSPEMMTRIRAVLPGHDAAVALQVTATLYFRGVTALPVVFEEAEVAVIRDQYVSETRVARKLRRGLTWWKYSRFVRELCRHAAMTTVVSDTERAILEEIGCEADRVAAVPNGVDALDLEWPRPAHRAQRIIYPGSLTYAANADAVAWFLGSVLPLVHRARPDVDFWVTGRTDGASVADPGPSARLTLTGHLPDVRPAIAESGACVVPLRIGGGTRLKILQSMALGTPVVSTSKGAEGLGVTPGVDILIGDTPEAFAAHTLRLLGDRGLADNLAAAARTLVRDRYTWARSGALLNDAVERAVGEWTATRR
jgi:glycosyltransferase involved in cell wall biosynthesis